MGIAYGIMLIISIALLILYCALVHKKERWLVVLYAGVCLVNLGYLILALSSFVDIALLANKLAYLGHIILLISMYLTITKLCGFNYKKWLPITLIVVGVVMFAIVCTAGYLPWYYKSVSLVRVDGAIKLVKEYGPLHVIYLIYVLAYLAMMLVTIIYSIATKKVTSRKQAGLLTAVVLCNIVMWIIEKFATWNFEFLSVSYVLSAGMLFFLYWMMQDFVHKCNLPPPEKTRVIVLDAIPKAERIKRVLALVPDGKKLTTRQMEMIDGLLDGKSQKEIANDLNISENTVKWHVGLLYSTLNVSGKDELFKLLNQN